MTTPLMVALVVLAGALIPVQPGINAELGRRLGHPLLAALTNFAVGGALIAGTALLLRVPFPSLAAARGAPSWAWLGGACGAVLVYTGLTVAPRIGALALVAALVTGQLGASVLVDHFGWVGLDARPATLTRLLGVLLLGAGVVMVHRG